MTPGVHERQSRELEPVVCHPADTNKSNYITAIYCGPPPLPAARCARLDGLDGGLSTKHKLIHRRSIVRVLCGTDLLPAPVRIDLAGRSFGIGSENSVFLGSILK